MATRSLREIAQEIKREWPNVSIYAKPYLDAMATLDSVKDYYYYDSGDSIVRYFLANATSWRGEAARRIKKELKDLCSN